MILYKKLKYNIWVQVLLLIVLIENLNWQSKFSAKLTVGQMAILHFF